MTSPKRVGFLGPEGTFSEVALKTYFTEDVKAVSYRHIAGLPPTFVSGAPFRPPLSLFEAISIDEVDSIIVPWENSTEGPVTVAVDALLHSQNIRIVGELVLPIHLSLISRKDVSKAQITDILSHPQPLQQCHHYLAKNFPHSDQHAFSSTAAAAKIISQAREKHSISIGKSTETCAVIGDPSLVEKYSNLHILEDNIQDSDSNSTRFFIVAKTNTVPTGDDKTTVVFSTKQDQPGSLYQALGVFAKRHINLSSIASRPAKTELGEYLFFIDIEGHAQDPSVSEALLALKEVTSYVKVLGSYPRFKH